MFLEKLLQIFALASLSSLLFAVENISVTSSGSQINGNSSEASISADGRFIAFQSDASDLVSIDADANRDIFLHDTQSNTTILISADTSGTGSGNGSSSNPAISANGRFVVFQSNASNLISNDTNNTSDIFLRDTLNGTTELISINSAGSELANFASSTPTISPDARFVAFASQASNLVSGDTNINFDIFLRDRNNSTTTLISLNTTGSGPGNSNSFNPAFSADGRFIAFQSAASNLVMGDSNGATDVFLRDTMSNSTTLISFDSTNTSSADGNSFNPVMSADGRFVAFDSDAINIVDNDSNGVSDVFLRDTLNNTSRLISIPLNAALNGDSSEPSISADGNFIVFQSDASNITADDANSARDAFIYDVLADEVRLLSRSNSSCMSADAESAIPVISSDGQFIAYDSFASDLITGDVNENRDIFLQNRLAESGPLVSATLPASRSVQVGQPATAFASIINTSACEIATNCDILPITSIAANFVYQTTDSANNLVGAANLPVDIPISSTQNFVIGFTPTAPFSPTDVAFTYDCGNTASAINTVGLNTVLLSADANPVADVIALTTVVDLQASIGNIALFAVGSSNVGITSDVLVSLDDNGQNLPLSMNVCQTDIAGVCLAAPSPSVNLNYSGASTASFAIFVEVTSTIANDPANNRIFIRFTDSNGVVRGATSTAIRTQ